MISEFPITPTDLLSKRILVVDDCKDAATILKLLLERVSNHVYVAYDGPEALRVAEEVSPDIVLLDISLPSMSGYVVARKLRERLLDHELTLIAITGWGRQCDRMSAIEAGFDFFLLKPVGFDVLKKIFAEMPATAFEVVS
jgi:two-component system, sensor histidine kinase